MSVTTVGFSFMNKGVPTTTQCWKISQNGLPNQRMTKAEILLITWTYEWHEKKLNPRGLVGRTPKRGWPGFNGAEKKKGKPKWCQRMRLRYGCAGGQACSRDRSLAFQGVSWHRRERDERGTEQRRKSEGLNGQFGSLGLPGPLMASPQHGFSHTHTHAYIHTPTHCLHLRLWARDD